MGGSSPQPWAGDAVAVWRGRQHGVVTRAQLLALGMGPRSIEHRVASGRLHPLMRGVYAVGRPGVGSVDGGWRRRSPAGRRRCSATTARRRSGASDGAAATTEDERRRGRMSQGRSASTSRPAGLQGSARASAYIGGGITRRRDGGRSTGSRSPTPSQPWSTSRPACPTGQLEAAVNEADHLDAGRPRASCLARSARCRAGRGSTRLRRLLDGADRRPDHHRAGAALPAARGGSRAAGSGRRRSGSTDTGSISTGRELGLVVEADSLRYHRTAFQAGERQAARQRPRRRRA